MRASEHGLAQRCRFQQVVSAVGHQAAADEGNVRQRVEKQQLAHGIAEQHLRMCGDGLTLRAPDRGETLLTAQLGHRPKALRMARHQDQQCLWMPLQQAPMRGQDDLVFAGMGARRDPHRPPPRVPLRAQFARTRQ
ncbi:hypothetical protein SSTU70S_03995 [Stutzerimonas stutzeri]